MIFLQQQLQQLYQQQARGSGAQYQAQQAYGQQGAYGAYGGYGAPNSFAK